MKPEKIPFAPGNYSYLPGGFQYSAAVIAEPGYVIEHARFSRLVPMAAAFEHIEAHLSARGLPSTALCACELRSPAPMTEEDFVVFNQGYVQPLTRMGLYRDGVNPVARCNLVPGALPPLEPSFFGFSYVVPAERPVGIPDFVTSGAAECPDRPGYRNNIVRLGETSPEALRDKLKFAIGDLESRFEVLQLNRRDVSSMRLYSVHDLHAALLSEAIPRGAMVNGLEWHFVRPPILDLEIEIDARRVSQGILISV